MTLRLKRGAGSEQQEWARLTAPSSERRRDKLYPFLVDM